MYILKDTTIDNNPVSMHVLGRVEIQGEMVTFQTHSSNPASDGTQSYMLNHTMPVETFSSVPYPNCITNWLTRPGGFLEDGVVIPDGNLTLEMRQGHLTTLAVRQRDAHIAGGIMFQSLGIDTDATSLRNIMGTAQMATLSKFAGQPFAIAWRCSDNTMANFDADNFIELSEAVMVHVQACYARSWELKEEIANATIDNIDAINPATGWPNEGVIYALDPSN